MLRGALACANRPTDARTGWHLIIRQTCTISPLSGTANMVPCVRMSTKYWSPSYPSLRRRTDATDASAASCTPYSSLVVLREGSFHPITNGTVGEITRNGVFTAVFSNMISLSLPALISVLRDGAHVKTYLLRRALFKADVGHRDKAGGDVEHEQRSRQKRFLSLRTIF